ncbi:hypothetical protein [Microbacterium sp. NPDC096154]|uniref:hypothetical protein n=1 Tax=Microbacterium sp. NPDC096154 TaxID=3155549 RepID=UPI003320572F
MTSVLRDAVDAGRGAAVLDALRNGRATQVVELLERFPPEQRSAIRGGVTGTASAILSAPSGSTHPDRLWRGPLRSGHWHAAQTALLATATVPQALRLRTFDGPVATEHIPRLFPGDLPAFVDAFSTRYLSNPKAWDGNRGIEAMFDWAERGLIEAPTQQGAVLILICWAPRPSLWSFLQRHPRAIRTTLPRVFEVPGIKGASAAQRDEAGPAPRLDRYVIPRLIREGHWTRDEVLSWCATALDMPRSEYEHRWFRALQDRISAMKRPD